LRTGCKLNTIAEFHSQQEPFNYIVMNKADLVNLVAARTEL